jgi:hypothetical protein
VHAVGFRHVDIVEMVHMEAARLSADASLKGYPEGLLGSRASYPWMFAPHTATPFGQRVEQGSKWLLNALNPESAKEAT